MNYNEKEYFQVYYIAIIIDFCIDKCNVKSR